MTTLPKRYKPDACEDHWRAQWDAWGLYDHDPSATGPTFTVDTPPPTVSGELHVGHVFSYTHQDLIVRYQRMKGRAIRYGMGWDDNGLPTERRVQNAFAIRCDPSLPYDPGWSPTRATRRSRTQRVSRRNFIEACHQLTAEDEHAFEQMWRRLGLSVDWSRTYRTIGPRAQRLAQASFLDLARRGLAYSNEAPTMWDVDFQTAIAQAEIEERPTAGLLSELRFGLADSPGEGFSIATTRPELLGACIAVVAHPDDPRWSHLLGRTAITPLYEAAVPILPSEHADPDKGTGALMVCTFGDAADVDWWKGSGLPIKPLLDRAGCLRGDLDFETGLFASRSPDRAARHHAELSGLYTKPARARILTMLASSGTDPSGPTRAALLGEPRQIERPVRFYEKGQRPIEYLTTRQWFIRLVDHKEALLEQGHAIAWHPESMRTRYTHWVQGLEQDWCISRQRFFGTPFPVWYPLDDAGAPCFDRPLFADPERLPLDPMTESPPGYNEAQRDQPGGFIADRDIMDTWATSALTPSLALGAGETLPMDIRPQSHEIIRTWAFYTIALAWMHHDALPWRHVLISGWILDPDRKKMGKSRGNALTPGHLFDDHSVDAVRYWAARARLGADTAFDPTAFPVGRRLANKLFNASRFVGLIRAQAGDPEVTATDITHPLDLAICATLNQTILACTEAFDRFDFASALKLAEAAFWSFCDNALELLKGRAYDEQDSPARRSALATCCLALRALLRLLAPFLPHVTEECWSWWFASGEGRARSIHTAPWPTADELGDSAGDPTIYEAASLAIGAIRGSKTRAQRSLKWPVSRLHAAGSASWLEALEAAQDDVARAGWLQPEAFQMKLDPEGDGLAVEVELAEG